MTGVLPTVIASSEDNLPLPLETVGIPVTGLRIIHHNDCGLLSKFPELSQ